MRKLLLLVEILFALALHAQEPDQLERRQEGTDRVVEEEPLLQEQSWRRRHPLCINSAPAEVLRTLPRISELQVQSLVAWRTSMGPLLAVEELAAVPYWDAETVRRLQPMLTTRESPLASGAGLLHRGEHSFLLRTSVPLGRTADFEKAQYAGGPERVYLRYRYRMDDALRWGISLEKDPGEPLARGPDFTSAHLFWQGTGLVRSIALGDFTVNMGQGLIQWDAPAFGGGADLAAMKRQGPFLQPFLSADEYHFARGAGVTLQKGAWQASAYVSVRRLSGRIDSAGSDAGIASINSSGYHRTASERAGRNVLGMRAAGGRLQWERGALRLSLQGRLIGFSEPLLPGKEPYERFDAQGRSLRHGSIDWSYTHGPAHVFGEGATDGRGGFALVQGLLFSGGALWDLAVDYRHLSPRYAAFDGNAVARRSEPQNEDGLYLGLSVHPPRGWHLEAWADGYRFPWLRYGIDGPSGGWQGGIQAGWHPNRKTEASLRFRYGSDNETAEGEGPLSVLETARKRTLRLQLAQDWGGGWRGAFRAECLWLDEPAGRSTGFVQSFGLHLPPLWKLRAGVQAVFFDTDSYAARLYQYTEAPAGGQVLAFYGEGSRYSVHIQYDAPGGVNISLQGVGTTYSTRPGVPPGPGKTAPELRVQLSWHL
ncbi:ComEA family DNA-binding protein [Flaviaesturariibacter terrae]